MTLKLRITSSMPQKPIPKWRDNLSSEQQPSVSDAARQTRNKKIWVYLTIDIWEVLWYFIIFSYITF